MTKDDAANRIIEIGIVPVIRAASSEQAMQAAEAVCAGGVPVVEVTMTVPGAIEVIARLATSLGPEILIGAGTVLDAETAKRCIDAGAEFIVSPGFDLETVRVVNRTGKLMMAGALTPSEVIAAWKAGSDFVKIFPCGAVGGAKYIKALKAPLPQIPMIPTGGVNLITAADFILAGSAALGIGGELVSAAALESGNTDLIVEAARSFASIVRNARKAA
jgi:2-dehydro-3-deoxyphosphogluconate aldolase/(4S)-4-hydroxy-2-oxoglutarate aldolase